MISIKRKQTHTEREREGQCDWHNYKCDLSTDREHGGKGQISDRETDGDGGRGASEDRNEDGTCGPF